MSDTSALSPSHRGTGTGARPLKGYLTHRRAAWPDSPDNSLISLVNLDNSQDNRDSPDNSLDNSQVSRRVLASSSPAKKMTTRTSTA